MTAKQFRMWQHYAMLEPFDETRADYRVAGIISMLYNVNKGKNQKALTVKDVMKSLFDFEGADESKGSRRYDPQTPAEMLQVLKALSVMQNTMVAQGTPEAKD